MANANNSSKLGALLVLLRAFRGGSAPRRGSAPQHRKVPAERHSQPAVEVTSDFGFSPIFPGMR